MKCECGGDLFGLYYTRSLAPENADEFTDTEDYWFCVKCNTVYRRNIKTAVEWIKL